MGRVWAALSRDYGRQIPSGYRIYGWMFWLAGLVLTIVGLVSLINGQAILGPSLIAAGVLAIAQTFTGVGTPPS